MENNQVWTEKYRPKEWDGLICDFKEKFIRLLKEPKQMQHILLFSQKPGTGKTTIAKIIINQLKADNLQLNASDERKMEVIREKIKTFVKSMSSNPGVPRIVFLDECDGMLKASQEALRSLMEEYTDNAKFILTCNNIDKIIEPIQ